MKNTKTIFTLTLSIFLLFGCSGPQESESISSSEEHTFCGDDSRYFSFTFNTALADAITALPAGVQSDENRDEILSILGSNDGYANTANLTLSTIVDFGTVGTLDHALDFTGQYSKDVTRYSQEKILDGDFSMYEHFYDEDAAAEVTVDQNAAYQVFRNGYCPSVSRYYEIYDFTDNNYDLAIEEVYDTEHYIQKLNLVNGQALALDLNNYFDDFVVKGSYSSLTFTANKYLSDEDGVINVNASLNTHNALALDVSVSYLVDPPATNEEASHSVIIVDGMIKAIRDFRGEYEVSGETKIYHESEEKTISYSVETVGGFAGTTLDPTTFTFSTTTPIL
ncbi:MAG: hypothetical protein WC282_02275 [Bacilli bacterium]|jgi:hypothetical protein